MLATQHLRTEYVTIPEGVTVIGLSMFSGCSNLLSVVIPNSVTKICNDAFRECVALQSIELPKALETIEDRIFMGCKTLSKICFRGGNPPSFGNQVFSGGADEVVVYVPSAEAVKRYREISALSDAVDVILEYDM